MPSSALLSPETSLARRLISRLRVNSPIAAEVLALQVQDVADADERRRHQALDGRLLLQRERVTIRRQRHAVFGKRVADGGDAEQRLRHALGIVAPALEREPLLVVRERARHVALEVHRVRQVLQRFPFRAAVADCPGNIAHPFVGGL